MGTVGREESVWRARSVVDSLWGTTLGCDERVDLERNGVGRERECVLGERGVGRRSDVEKEGAGVRGGGQRSVPSSSPRVLKPSQQLSETPSDTHDFTRIDIKAALGWGGAGRRAARVEDDVM